MLLSTLISTRIVGSVKWVKQQFIHPLTWYILFVLWQEQKYVYVDDFQYYFFELSTYVTSKKNYKLWSHHNFSRNSSWLKYLHPVLDYWSLGEPGLEEVKESDTQKQLLDRRQQRVESSHFNSMMKLLII